MSAFDCRDSFCDVGRSLLPLCAIPRRRGAAVGDIVRSVPMDEEEFSTKEFVVGLAVVVVCGGLTGAGMMLHWGYATALIWPVGIIGFSLWHKRQGKKSDGVTGPDSP